MLQFLGRGSAFADEHNTAFFKQDGDFVLLDCSMTAYFKVKKMDLSGINNIYVLVTHTHSDHIGGIAMLIDYEFFVGKIPVTIVAPSIETRDDLSFYLSRLDGCSSEWYTLISVNELQKAWFNKAILTKHSPQLEGRCFGYSLTVNNTRTVYTGDSATLAPFEEEITDDAELYTESTAYSSEVHMYISDWLDTLTKLSNNGTKVYLMHLDDEDYIASKISGTEIKLAPLYQEKC